jgi:hypothetical protein
MRSVGYKVFIQRNIGRAYPSDSGNYGSRRKTNNPAWRSLLPNMEIRIRRVGGKGFLAEILALFKNLKARIHKINVTYLMTNTYISFFYFFSIARIAFSSPLRKGRLIVHGQGS